MPSILNKRRFTAKIISLTDARRNGAKLLKATVPGRVDLSMNPSTLLDLRRGAARFFAEMARSLPHRFAIFVGDS